MVNNVFNDPLSWEKENCNRFPLVTALALLALLLATPAPLAQPTVIFEGLLIGHGPRIEALTWSYRLSDAACDQAQGGRIRK